MQKRVLPDDVINLLNASGRQWSLERGSKHWHIIVDGRLAAIWPYGTGRRTDYAPRNAVVGLRRFLNRMATHA